MGNLVHIAVVSAVGYLAMPAVGNATPIRWSFAEGGNGHWYELSTVGSWSSARNQALAGNGDLVAINSTEENAWLVQAFDSSTAYWIGFRQFPGSTEPAGGWEWSNGDPVTFVNWHPAQPDNCAGGVPPCAAQSESKINWGVPGMWDDTSSGDTMGIIEFAPCNLADLALPVSVLDLADVNAFTAGFVAMDPVADLNADGLFDLSDINTFVESFTGGCV